MDGTRPSTILFCWEYGAGLGHFAKLAVLAKSLKPHGHRLVLVYPDNTAPGSTADLYDECITLPSARSLDFGDINQTFISSYLSAIDNMGLSSDRYVFTRLSLWTGVIERVQPDLIVADFAPCALMAARGKVPTIALGNPYTLPPVGIEDYPNFMARPETTDGAAILAAINRAMALCGQRALPLVSEVFRADFQACCGFDQFDPFRSVRREPCLPPLFSAEPPKVQEGDTKGCFAYLTHAKHGLRLPVLKGLALAADQGIPNTVYALDLNEQERDVLAGSVINVLEKPMEPSKIASRFQIVITHGGHGLTDDMLMAGVPQVIFSIDIEKRLRLALMKRYGIADGFPLKPDTDPQDVAACIQSVLENASQRNTARTFAAEQPAGVETRALDTILEKVRDLLRA